MTKSSTSYVSYRKFEEKSRIKSRKIRQKYQKRIGKLQRERDARLEEVKKAVRKKYLQYKVSKISSRSKK